MQVYVLAAVCLALGLPVGYLLRGSAPEQRSRAGSAPAAACRMPAAAAEA